MTSPDGASPGGSIMSLASFASQTEDSVQAPVNNAIASIFTFDQLFGGIGSAIGNLLGGSFTPDGPGTVAAIEHLSAKTQALIDDIDLLNGVPAYGAVYQSFNKQFAQTSFDPPPEQYNTLPFNAPIGPRKRVDIISSGSTTNGGLKGYDPGLWEASVLTYVDISGGAGAPSCNTMILIDVFDTTGGYLFSYAPVITNSGNGQDPFSMTCTFPFVIPANVGHFNVFIRVAAQSNGRKWMGGTKYSGLWLRRISEDVANSSPLAVVPDA